MKKTIIKNLTKFLILTLAISSVVFGAQETKSAIRDTVNFQGKVQNSDGTNVADGAYNFEFKIYDGPASTDTLLWTETWGANVFSAAVNVSVAANETTINYDGGSNWTTLKVGQVLYNATDVDRVYITDVSGSTGAAGTITVSNTSKIWSDNAAITIRHYLKDGIFSVELNSLQADWSNVDFGTNNLWLGVNFSGDGEMKPRKRLTAVPYARNALNVIGSGYIDIDNTSILKDAFNVNYAPAAATSNSAASITYNSSGGGTGSALTVTQSGTGKIVDLTGDSITTGTGFSLSVDGLTTGSGLAIDSASTSFNGGKLLNLTASGALGSAGTVYGVYSALTGANANNTNVAGYFSASGAGSTNYGLIVANGNVGIGDTSPASLLTVGNGDLFQVNSSGQVVAGAWQGTIISTQYGGTGQNFSSTSQGSIPYFSAAGTMSALSAGTSGYFLKTQGAGANPVWSEVVQVWSDSGTALYPTTLSRRVGIGTTGPDRYLDVLDASNPQMRLTQADGTIYGDFQIDSNGDLTIATTGDEIKIDDHLRFTTDNTYDLGASGATRPRTGYFGTSVIVGGTTTIDANSITLTNLGSGNSLLVNDEASDTTPFVIDASGKVGVGVTTPSVSLHVAGQCVTADTKLRRRRKKKKGEKAGEEAGEWEDDEYIYDEVMIKDIQPGDEIASMNPITGELAYRQVNALMDMGERVVYKLVTQTGRQIKTTDNHPYFVRTKYESQEEKQNQKLYRFEVDQSIKIEQFSKDSVVAIANAENSFSVVIPRGVKQTLRDTLRKNQTKKFNAIVFAAAIMKAVDKIDAIVHELTIDTEYIGYEKVIADVITTAFPTINISFNKVGKKSPAHYAASFVHIKKKTADYTVDIDDIEYKAENALRRSVFSHSQRGESLDTPRASLINNSINDNKNLVKSGNWKKVKELKEGQIIAVTHGNKIVWEKIVEIKQLPAERVYDIEVEGTHNFVANDIIAHNTYINTNSATALRVEQDGVKDDVLVVDTAAGNVGIGTATPLSTLDVRGAIENGLVAWWSMDEGTGTTIADQSINSNTGTLGGDGVGIDLPSWTNGKFSKALSFDGSDDYVDAGNGASLNITNAITVTAWFKLNSISGYNSIVVKDLSDSVIPYLLRIYNGNPRFDTYHDATTYSSGEAPVVSTGIWYFVAGTFDESLASGNLKIYVDGILKSSGTHTDPLPANTANVKFGYYGGVYTNGSIDEVRIYNRALSEREVAEHYRQQAPSMAQGGTISDSSAYTALTVQQSSTGNIVDFKDGAVSVFKISDGGNITASEFNNIIYVDGTKYTADSPGIQNAIDDLPSTGGKVVIPEGTYNVDRAMDACVADDGGSYTTQTTACNDATANDVTLLPAVPALNDAYYFGYDYRTRKVTVNIGTPGVGTWTLTWEYWDGSVWTGLASVSDGTTGFTAAAGERNVTYTFPTNWAQTSVNSITKYWVRARVSAYTSITTQPFGTQAFGEGSIYIGSNTALVGSGPSSIIKIINSYNADVYAIRNSNPTGGNSYIQISDLKIDGNRANNASGYQYGIWFQKVTYSKVSNTWIESLRTAGILLLDASNNNVASDNNTKDIYNQNIHIQNSNYNTVSGNTLTAGGGSNIGIGIYVQLASANNSITGNTVQGEYNGIYLDAATDNTIAGNNLQGNNYNIYIISSSHKNTISGNTATGGYYGIYLSSSNYNNISGNTTRGVYRDGIYIDGSNNNLVSSNYSLENSTESNNNYSNITITTNSDYNYIEGNVVRQGALANKPKYGINIATADSDNNTVINNDVYDSGVTAAYNDSGTNTRWVTVDSTGNVGIGSSATPTSRMDIFQNSTQTALTVTQSGTGNIVDLKYSTTSLFTLNNEDRLTLDGTLMTTMGALNTNLIDDMEAITDWTLTEIAGSGQTVLSLEATNIKVNDGAMKLTTTTGGVSEGDYVKKDLGAGSEVNLSAVGRIGFWIRASETGQIISFQFSEDDVTYQDYNVTINNANEWQYEEWDISGITGTSRDAVRYFRFYIDEDNNAPAIYIDQARYYNASSATNRMAEFFLDASGNLVLTGDEGVEIGRTVPGSSLPSMKIGAATVEVRNPLDLQVEGDVGVEYNLAFLNNDTSYITSAGPLIISGGDSNSYENLTITTSGTGDVIVDIADSASGFKVVGTGGGVFTIDASGNVVIGGVNATDSDLTVKRNIATQGGNITIAKLNIASAGTPTTSVTTSGGSCLSATTYYYRIVAVNGNGETDIDNATSVSQATGGAGNDEIITVSWDAVSGATGYKVYRDTDDDWADGADSLVDSAAISSPTIGVDDNCSGDLASQTPSTVNTTGGDITGILSFSNATNLTLSSDAITVTQTYHTVDEEGAAIDDLLTINGGTAGDILVLRGYDTDYAVTAGETGNLELAGTFAFTDPNDTLTLIFNGTKWLEVSRSTNGADIAESYYTSDLSIEAGDIVAISSTNGVEKLEDKPNYFVEKTSKTYDSKLLGVISTNPFMTMGGGYGKITDENGNIKAETRSVALAGRVPVKVSLENGAIEIGDFLTSSSQSGVAMSACGARLPDGQGSAEGGKAYQCKSGRVIGQALEPFDGNITECSVEAVKMEVGNETAEAENGKEPETLRVVNCRKVPGEVGKVTTFINVGWQSFEEGAAQQDQSQSSKWLEMNGWCVTIDENGEWQKVRKTAETCEEAAASAANSNNQAPSSNQIPSSNDQTLAPTPTPTLELSPTPEQVPVSEPTVAPEPALLPAEASQGAEVGEPAQETIP